MDIIENQFQFYENIQNTFFSEEKNLFMGKGNVPNLLLHSPKVIISLCYSEVVLLNDKLQNGNNHSHKLFKPFLAFFLIY